MFLLIKVVCIGYKINIIGSNINENLEKLKIIKKFYLFEDINISKTRVKKKKLIKLVSKTIYINYDIHK